MKKKILVLFLITMTLGITGCGADSTGGADASGQTGSDAVCTVELTEGKYSEEKLDDSWDEATAIAVTLNGTSVECSDDAVRIQGSAATITKAGTYLLSGELTEGQIIVDVDSEDSVKLVLRQAAVQCSSSSPIYVANGKTIITLADGTENAVVDARTAAEEDDSNDYNAAIFAKDDLSFNGTGTLGVKAGYNHGIQSKNDLKFINGTYLIQSEGDALVGKDSVSVKAGEFSIQSGGDGIKATNEEESDQGYVMIDGGKYSIACKDNGIHAETLLRINDGDIVITECEEGLEGYYVVLDGGNIDLTATDDGVNAAGGTTSTENADFVDRGSAPEGKEKMGERLPRTQDEGKLPKGEQPTPSEDSVSSATPPTDKHRDGAGGRGGFAGENQGAKLTINGGTLKVNAGGDGLDANGDIEINGGTIIVQGASDSGNGALDYGGSCTMNGGTLMAVGAAGMAQTPDAESSQTYVSERLEATSPEGIALTVTDAAGNTLASMVSEKEFNWYCVSTPQMEDGASYQIRIGTEEYEVTGK